MVYKNTNGQQWSVFAKRMGTILNNLNPDYLFGYCFCQKTNVSISSFYTIRVDERLMYCIHSFYCLDTGIPDLYLDFKLFWLVFKLLYAFNMDLNHCASNKRLKKILQVNLFIIRNIKSWC